MRTAGAGHRRAATAPYWLRGTPPIMANKRGAELADMGHLQLGPRSVVFTPVAAAAAIGINASFNTGISARVGAATVDA